MGRYEHRVWGEAAEPYRAYVPDSIADRAVVLEPETAGMLSAAEVSMRLFENTHAVGASAPALARAMMLAETVASSLIEGIGVNDDVFFRGLLDRWQGGGVEPAMCVQVLDNLSAMEAGLTGAGGEITLDAVLEVNRRVQEHSRLRAYGGQLREVQNWVGRSGDTPVSAAFVPPPPECVPGLMEDLVLFCNHEELPPVAHAALAHVQFETIHPFADGNGRTGRVLSHMVLRRRGVGLDMLTPISTALYDWHRDYVGGLIVSRYDDDGGSMRANAAVNQWLRFFAEACEHAVAGANRYMEWVGEIQRLDGLRLGGMRVDAGARRLLEQLPAHPVLNSALSADLTGRSRQSANVFLRELCEVGVLVPEGEGRRNRVFRAPEYCDLFTELVVCRTSERDLGDTFVV